MIIREKNYHKKKEYSEPKIKGQKIEVRSRLKKKKKDISNRFLGSTNQT